MKISSLSYDTYARYYDSSDLLGTAIGDTAREQLGALEAELDPLGGMANDTAIDKMNAASKGSMELPGGFGKVGKELGEGSALGDISRAFGRDTLKDAEALANGDTGGNLPGISMQDRFGDAVDRAGGATSEGGTKWQHRGELWGSIGGCIGGKLLGIGCKDGSHIGHMIGGAIGFIADVSGDSSGSEKSPGTDNGNKSERATDAGADASQSSESTKDKESEGTSESACDPLSQSCPSTGGMGDDQDGQSTKGDPTMNSIEIARRAKGGDGRAAAVLAVRGGSASELVPAWTKNSDAREGQGKGHHEGDALLKGITRLDAVRESGEGAQPAGRRPGHDFATLVAARAANPVVQPLPM